MKYILIISALLYGSLVNASVKEEAVTFLTSAMTEDMSDENGVSADGCTGEARLYLRDFVPVAPEEHTDDVYISIKIDYLDVFLDTARWKYEPSFSSRVLVADCEDCRDISMEKSADPSHENVSALEPYLVNFLMQQQPRITVKPVVAESRINNAVEALHKHCYSERDGF